MNVKAQACVPLLVDLGFTETEAAAYTFLVQHAPATGYGVARGIEKPVANTYKALHSLRHKGAVIVDETARQRCRAVPPAELMELLEQNRRSRLEDASRALAALEPAVGDEGVYTLTSRHQALERFRDMLGRAREGALVDIFPEPLATLRGAIEAAAARGVVIAVQVYEPVRLKGVEVVCHEQADAMMRRWPGQWLNLVIDGSEHLLAFFGRDAVQATWSRSTYLSWIYHGGLYSEMMASRLGSALDQGLSPAAIKRIRRRFRRFLVPDSGGFKELRHRLTHRRAKSSSTP